MAGANLIYGLGMIESGVTFDFGELVMDAEMARMIKHCVGGIPVSDATLLVDDIHRVGSFGDFLSLDSTYQRMREQSQPTLIDRRVREDWQAAGGGDLHERALAKARAIIETHEPLPIADDVRAAMREVITAAEVDLGVRSRT